MTNKIPVEVDGCLRPKRNLKALIFILSVVEMPWNSIVKHSFSEFQIRKL